MVVDSSSTYLHAAPTDRDDQGGRLGTGARCGEAMAQTRRSGQALSLCLLLLLLLSFSGFRGKRRLCAVVLVVLCMALFVALYAL